MSEILWCAHVRGPDDVHAAASYDEAVRVCDEINAMVALSNAKSPALADVMCIAYPAIWPWSAEQHAKDLANPTA